MNDNDVVILILSNSFTKKDISFRISEETFENVKPMLEDLCKELVTFSYCYRKG